MLRKVGLAVALCIFGFFFSLMAANAQTVTPTSTVITVDGVIVRIDTKLGKTNETLYFPVVRFTPTYGVAQEYGWNSLAAAEIPYKVGDKANIRYTTDSSGNLSILGGKIFMAGDPQPWQPNYSLIFTVVLLGAFALSVFLYFYMVKWPRYRRKIASPQS
jgi:hypothetical protein